MALHQAFAWLQPAPVKFAIFRVPAETLPLKVLSGRLDSVCGAHPLDGGAPTSVTFIAPAGLPPDDSRHC